jgi:hypothetical protein
MRLRASMTVGRNTEVQVLADAIEAARRGHGGAIFLVGEAGIGKSRLAAETADRAFAANLALLRGRGSTIGPTVPFRPLTEAVLSLRRGGEAIDVTELGPYRPALGRLVPDWSAAPPGEEDPSLVILAEAVLRLTGLAGRGRGALMILDDLHDADVESLAVVEYLIDNLQWQPTLLVCTVRDVPGEALDLARSAAQRGTCTLVELHRLDRGDLCELAASCLGCAGSDVPDEVLDRLWADSAGNPFIAEEMLGAMVAGGFLVRGPDGWRLVGRPQTSVPVTLTRAVAGRLDRLDERSRGLLSVAAVLGRRFPLTVVQAVTGLDDRTLLGHLQGGVDAQLVRPDDELSDWYQFHHPLTAEAVLALLAPGERATIAQRAADVVEATYPGLPGQWCQMAAALRLEAGEPVAAGRLFGECGKRALASGAASSAVTLLDRARELLAGDSDPDVRADVLESLLTALAEAGQIERALAAAGALDELGGGGLDVRRRAALHTRLASAANVGGQPADGLAQVNLARLLLGPDPLPEATAPIDVVEAYVTLALPGRDRVATAQALARRAASVAEAVPLPMVACQAWQLLGVLTRGTDLDESFACLERAHAAAVRYRLPIREIHALIHLGGHEALREGGIEALEQAREKALRAGAVAAGYTAEGIIALQMVLRGDFDAAEAAIDRVLPAAVRLKLVETTQYALLTRAVLGAHRGRRAAMEGALAEFGRWQGNQSYHAPLGIGLARAFCALLEEDRQRATAELDRALAMEDENPTAFYLSGRHGLRILLWALAGELDHARLATLSAVSASELRWNRQFVLLAEAVLHGRAGHRAAADTAAAQAGRAAEPYRMARWLGVRLVAEAALADGWGNPVEWLRGAEEYFHNAGTTAVAGACRALLRNTGVPVNQRRPGQERIPGKLRSIGVTTREYEVLTLLAGRHGNRAIAGRLHISPRTVEKHVASLLSKTGQPDRIALGEYAEKIFTG